MTAQSTAFGLLMKQIHHLPLWIKQVIYKELSQDLEQSMAKSSLDAISQADFLQLMVPVVSKQGLQELHAPQDKTPQPLLLLMRQAEDHMNIANCCVMNQWTLEYCCTLLHAGIDCGFIAQPTSKTIWGTIQYLANQIRLGEFLVLTDRLSMQNLEQALKTQQYINDALGEKTGLGDVLINLGHISREDSEGILFLKQESQKVFQLQAGLPARNLEDDPSQPIHGELLTTGSLTSLQDSLKHLPKSDALIQKPIEVLVSRPQPNEDERSVREKLLAASLELPPPPERIPERRGSRFTKRKEERAAGFFGLRF